MTALGNLPNLRQQPSLTPITPIVGASVNYATQVNESWVMGKQDVGQFFNRSNATSAMTDTLPNPAQSTGSIGPLPNGWNIIINNIDASASITLTPALPATINGTTSLTITAAHCSVITTDGVNYFSRTSPV